LPEAKPVVVSAASGAVVQGSEHITNKGEVEEEEEVSSRMQRGSRRQSQEQQWVLLLLLLLLMLAVAAAVVLHNHIEEVWPLSCNRKVARRA